MNEAVTLCDNCLECMHHNVCSITEEIKRIDALAIECIKPNTPYITLKISCNQFKPKQPGFR